MIKTRRLAWLAREADVIVAVDNPDNVLRARLCGRPGRSKPRILIEVNTGMERCGALPGEPTVELAKLVDSLPNLRFAGVMAWEGHSMEIKDPVAREAEIRRACGALVNTANACRAAGLDVQIVSAGGTGTYLTSAGVEGITEVQAGGGIFGDSTYRDLGANVIPALSIMAQVTSRPTPEKVMIDAGRKSIDPSARQPTVEGYETTGDMSFSAEHGRFTLATPSENPRVGGPGQTPLRLQRSDVPLARVFHRRAQWHRGCSLADPGSGTIAVGRADEKSSRRADGVGGTEIPPTSNRTQ